MHFCSVKGAVCTFRKFTRFFVYINTKDFDGLKVMKVLSHSMLKKVCS